MPFQAESAQEALPPGHPGRISGRRALAVAVLPAALALLSPACGTIRTVHRETLKPSAQDVRQMPGNVRFLKAHMKAGSLYLLHRWTVLAGDSLIEAEGDHLDANRDVIGRGSFRIPIDSVALFETNVVQTSSAMIPYTILLVGTLVGDALCAANPKACYGSCPTFYVEGGPPDQVEAEAFSHCVAPFLEETDVDALFRAQQPGKDTLRLRVTNEALETHVIRHADLLVAPRPAGSRVVRDGQGRFWEVSGLRPPGLAAGPEGDCADALANFDRVERFSLADSVDLAARETIQLQFSEPTPASGVLVIAARQTLLTTYLYYQTLAYMGSSAGAWIAKLEAAPASMRSLAGGLGRTLGKIEISVRDRRGAWVLAGVAGETGPIATDVHAVLVPDEAARPLEVRLRMARGSWRIDWIALGSRDREVIPIRIRPARVLRDGVVREDALQALRDPLRTLVTLPGDAYEIEYALPRSGVEYEYFLEARGYYLEWMRDEWLKEEDLGRARQVFLDPRGALRTMAPEFKTVEPHMEALFWASRYERAR